MRKNPFLVALMIGNAADSMGFDDICDAAATLREAGDLSLEEYMLFLDFAQRQLVNPNMN